MKRSTSLTLILLATAAAIVPASAAPKRKPAPVMPANVQLIPRDALFGNPVKSGAQISPDGKYLSWIAPVNGVRNVFVAPINNLAAAKQITTSKDRPIPAYFWSQDSKAIFYIQDKAGDENFLLYASDPATGAERLLTPFEKTTVRIMGMSQTHPGDVLVGVNNRDAKWHDVYRLNTASGKLTKVMENNGYAGFVTDDALNLRIASKSNDKGGMDYFRVDNGKIAEQPFLSTDLENSNTGPAGYTRDGKTLYWIDTRDGDTAALYAEDVATGQRRLIGRDARADIGGTLSDPRTGVVQGYAVDYLTNEWHISDPKVRADYEFFKRRLGPGEVVIADRTLADDIWLVATDPVVKPSATYKYDRKTKALTQLYVSRPDLVGAPLVPMWPVEIKSRDGMTLPSYLTLPADADANRDGKADRPVPAVLFVHGGPWGRDGYGYNPYHQWLANRGYAVLSVNYRASTGFGKKFLNAGNMQWHKAMHTDLIDAKNWLVANGISTDDKVAIMGGSYGGYATLVGLTFSPKAYACGVDIVGPSNLETLLSTIPPYWEAGRRQMYARMGDPGTDDGKAVLKAASPLYKAGDIVRPLLIGQGANDPRVKQAESDQIVTAMQSHNIPVTYVLFPDEGHGFRKPTNNIAFNAISEAFLGRCLGGRVEPMGDTVRKSTAIVKDGADFIPDLAAAAKK